MFEGRQKSEGRDRNMRQKLTPSDQATFRQAAIPSGPHSQHPWWCQKHDTIASLFLSLHRWQLEDLPAESPRPVNPPSMTDGLSDVRDLGLVAAQEPPHLRALSATLFSATLFSVALFSN
jgi:hypothetical protein